MDGVDITLQDIFIARKRIAGVAKQSPLISSPWLSERSGTAVSLKLETVQETNAFKVRGAANLLLGLTPEERERGVIAFSTGNHGMAVSYVARQLGVKATICVAETVPRARVERLRALGADVRVHGKVQDEAEILANQLEQELGLTMVKPFDDPRIIAGQGTIGLELLEQLPEIDTLVAPLSGGGLISGIALALKSANPAIRVVGVSMERAPFMYHSVRAGRPVELEELDTLANALMGGIGLDNRYTFQMVQRYIDEYVLVSEEEIAEGMLFALEKHRFAVEGAGAVGIAALLHGKVSGLGRSAAIVVSGGNVELPLLMQLARQYRKD